MSVIERMAPRGVNPCPTCGAEAGAWCVDRVTGKPRLALHDGRS